MIKIKNKLVLFIFTYKLCFMYYTINTSIYASIYFFNLYVYNCLYLYFSHFSSILQLFSFSCIFIYYLLFIIVFKLSTKKSTSSIELSLPKETLNVPSI